jgi:hypothetical protein
MSVGIGFFVGGVVINAGTLENIFARVNHIFQKYFWPTLSRLAPNRHACERSKVKAIGSRRRSSGSGQQLQAGGSGPTSPMFHVEQSRPAIRAGDVTTGDGEGLGVAIVEHGRRWGAKAGGLTHAPASLSRA